MAGRHVLLVEDEYFIAEDLVRTFTSYGAEVVGPVASVGEALDLVAATERLDAAVLDVNLQGEMAYPVADALAVRGVPFVFATGYDETSIPHRYVDVTRCEKPVDPEKIVHALFGSVTAGQARRNAGRDDVSDPLGRVERRPSV